MFSGSITRSYAIAVICLQIVVSVFLAAFIPAPQSVARASEVTVDWDPSDLPEPTPAVAGLAPASQADEGYADDSLQVPAGLDIASFGEEENPDALAWEHGGVEPIGSSPEGGYYTSDQLRVLGAIVDDGRCYTWYSQRVLPGEGLQIEGRHVSAEGYVVDAQERIVVASSDLPWGTQIDVPFGAGTAVVLDSGCASGVVDVYTDF